MTCATGDQQLTGMCDKRASFRLPLVTVMVAAAMATSAMAQQAQQPAPARPVPSTTPPAETPPPSPAAFAQTRRATLPQGFSVVLVLGDIQGTTTADDVPPAARKALVDMREFLPFKSYKLLDAAWVMCCGQQGSYAPADRRPPAQSNVSGGLSQTLSQTLRGPEDQEYELRLSTSRAEGSRVFVRFTLLASGAFRDVADATSASAASRTTARRIADLKDQRALLEKQLKEARTKYEAGVAPADPIAKLEMEIRRGDREIEDLTARLAEGSAGRSVARAGVEHAGRPSIIDTSFTMDVGETVVVGTSRLKGGTRALIALLTAVPPRGTTERKE
jgi:hypothetical protein